MTTLQSPAATLVVKRTIRASVERVYRAWTDPAELVKWHAPNERFVQTKVDVDNHVGGKRNTTMVHSDGDEFPITGHYVALEPNKMLSFTWEWTSPDGTERESLVTVDFLPVAEGTEITITHERLPHAESQQETSKGWTGCLEMLSGYLTDGAELKPAAA